MAVTDKYCQVKSRGSLQRANKKSKASSSEMNTTVYLEIQKLDLIVSC